MSNHNGCFSATGDNSCGCGNDSAVLTPLPRKNRPGLSALSYRIGTHASFLETMKARLSLADLSGDMTTEAQDRAKNLAEQLNGLTARDSNDPSIALLDAWAMVADVLTFYQERIANEGYLRTATEERSIHELSRLVGFRQRTGVAASTVLAYTIDPNTKGEVVIPAGSRVQSVPGQNELPQTFESSEDLKAYAELNMLKPRMSKAQRTVIYEKNDKQEDIPVLYLKGVHTNLKPDDRMLIEVANEVSSKLSTEAFYRVIAVSPDSEANRTRVSLECEKGEIGQRKIIKVYTFRTKTAPFGHNAPLKPYGMPGDKVMRYVEWQIDNPTLNPDMPEKAEFIIKRKTPVKDNGNMVIDIELENISTGYINKVSWIKYIDQNDEKGTPLLSDIEPERPEYRLFRTKDIRIGEYISLELIGLFDKKIGGFKDRKLVSIDKITHANFFIDNENSVFPTYTLIYDKKINDGEKEEFEIIDSDSNHIESISMDTPKKITFVKEGVYSVERKIKDGFDNLLSSCVRTIRAYNKPTASFEAKVESVEEATRKLVVKFTNTSAGAIDCIEWYFDDIKEQENTLNIKTHSYEIDSQYKARIIAIGPGGTSAFPPVDRSLILTFFIVKEQGSLIVNKKIDFINKSTDLSDSRCVWMFGDGELMQNETVGHHIYKTPGKYAVTLSVTRGAGGQAELYTKIIDIADEL